ncbi:ABC transporter ATP-binding protein [Streptosporangium carneum]|uniref:ABC transporter ATP-binding protein n=1 Tax=Streptosporangium carneum TaxID=47481 RepID=A0A9W6IC07_9ACTN|nr:ABC transporter ATP-binding protein [Streptosporangium carneum]
MLSLHEVTMRFGALKVVDGMNLTIRQGERRGLVGSPGSGKSTVMRLIAGALRPTGGRIEYGGRDVTDLPEERRPGIARVFQHGSAFAGLTCVEHVTMALRRSGLSASARSAGSTGWRTPARHNRLDQTRDVFDLLRITGLQDAPTALLCAVGRKRLEIAMALAARPRLLLLDEPMTGMTPQERVRFADLLLGLPAELTVVLTGCDAEAVAAVSSQLTMLERPDQITVPAWRARRRPARHVEREFRVPEHPAALPFADAG